MQFRIFILILALFLNGCATKYTITESQTKISNTIFDRVYACCISLKSVSYFDPSALKMDISHLGKSNFAGFFIFDFYPVPAIYGSIKPAIAGRDTITISVYADGILYGQKIETDAHGLKYPYVAVSEDFFKKLPSAKSAIISYVVSSGEKEISRADISLDSDSIQKIMSFYSKVLEKENKYTSS